MTCTNRLTYAAIFIFLALHVSSCATSSTDQHKDVSNSSNWATKVENPSLNEAEFTDCMAQMINESGKRKARVVGTLELMLSGFGQSGESPFYCTNAWKNCRDIPGERREALKPYLASITDDADDMLSEKLDLADIVPIIRTPDYAQGIPEKIKLYSEPFVSDLVVMYALDTKNSIQTLGAEKVRELNVEPAKLRKLAIQNLLRKFPEQTLRKGKDISMLTLGGDYETSFLLCDYFWKDMMKQLGGRLVVGVPSRDVLIFSAEKNKKGVEMIRNLTESGFAKNSYPISDKLLLYDGNWQPY